MTNRINICNLLIDNITTAEVLDNVELMIKAKESQYIVTPNVDHIIKLQTDKNFQEIYKNASLVLTDGTPLLWAAKYLGTPIKEKISGSDIFPVLCKLSSEKGYKVFFLGGRPDAAERAAKQLKNRYNKLDVVGIYAPPLGFENNEIENDKIITMIKCVQPDILFVGLGAPKQEKWIYKYRKDYNVPVSIGIGAAFEFIAGMVKRAPGWMQKTGLEWFWRVLMEPKRLWKRYFIDDMKIFRLVYSQKKYKNVNR